MADGITYCVDLAATSNAPHVKATRMADPSGYPHNSTVISRNAPIQVFRGDPESKPDPTTITEVAYESSTPPKEVVYADRPLPSDDQNIAMTRPVENGVGVIPTPRQESRVQPKATTTLVRPEPHQEPSTQLQANPAQEMPKPEPRVMLRQEQQKVAQAPQPVPQPPSPQQPRVVTAKRHKVRLSNEGMGRITVFVDNIVISDSIIILAYREDGSTAVAEPPKCGTDNPVFVEYENKQYPCIFGGWSAEMEERLLVVLVRISG